MRVPWLPDIREEELLKLTPTQRLLFAILNRALLDAADNSSVWSVDAGHLSNHRAARRDAFRWLMSKNMTPFSFHWVCEHLNIEPKEVLDTLNAKRKN